MSPTPRSVVPESYSHVNFASTPLRRMQGVCYLKIDWGFPSILALAEARDECLRRAGVVAACSVDDNVTPARQIREPLRVIQSVRHDHSLDVLLLEYVRLALLSHDGSQGDAVKDFTGRVEQLREYRSAPVYPLVNNLPGLVLPDLHKSGDAGEQQGALRRHFQWTDRCFCGG